MNDYDYETVAKDLASFNEAQEGDLLERLGKFMFPGGLLTYGLRVPVREVMRQRAVSFNHGKARKVSLKRPSPRLSRDELEQIKATAIMERTMRDGSIGG